jgi:hypothetical protein
MTTNVAVVSALIDGVRTTLGVTKGGADFEAATKWRAAEYDGRRHVAVGTEEIIMHGPSKMTFTLTEFSDKVLALIMPGADVTGGVYTPPPAGTMLTEDQYIQEPWYELTLRDGTVLRWAFERGIVTDSPAINTKDADEASMKVTIEARPNPATPGYTTDAADYTLTVVPAT